MKLLVIFCTTLVALAAADDCNVPKKVVYGLPMGNPAGANIRTQVQLAKVNGLKPLFSPKPSL